MPIYAARSPDPCLLPLAYRSPTSRFTRYGAVADDSTIVTAAGPAGFYPEDWRGIPMRKLVRLCRQP